RVAVLRLLEHLVGLQLDPSATRPWRHHAAAGRRPNTVCRTHAVSSRFRRRNSSRSCDFGPWPVTTERSSSHDGSVYSQTLVVSSSRRFGSGSFRPSSHSRGT